MPSEDSPDGTWCHPVAPLSWERDGVPHARHKTYSETRPNDFNSLKAVPEGKGLVRLLIGRLITADGHDFQDDYTLPIEKQFVHRPLGWILKYTYCRARGIPDSGTELSVRFMLVEAGAGLGWLDVSKSPRDLQLKDTDIVEVLVTRPPAAPGTEEAGAALIALGENGAEETAGKRPWLPPESWQEAIRFFEETLRSGLVGAEQWIPRAWSMLEKYAEDDNVILPGLNLLGAYIQEGSDCQELNDRSRARQVAACQDSIRILQRVLDVHSRNRDVQQAGWAILSDMAREPLLQPLLVQRGGIRSFATRAERSMELDGPAMASVRTLLERLANVPRPASGTATGPNPFTTKPLQARARQAPAKAQDEALTAEERSKRTCTLLGGRLQQAVQGHDSLVIDKTLRLLLRKIREGEVDNRGVEAARIGPLLGPLRNYEGDADVRELAQQVVLAIAKLQLADAIRS